MEAPTTRVEPVAARSRVRVECKYLVLAFALSWSLWIAAIKLHVREEFLHLGSAGPALAAFILSHRGKSDSPSRQFARPLLFLSSLAVCWIVLCLQYAWRNSSNLSVTLSPGLIVPCIVPAWIISAPLDRDSGVRKLARRVVHAPNRWSLVALLTFPLIILLPAHVAHLFHLPLVWPERAQAPAPWFAAAVVLYFYNLFFPALLEEPGWRGFLLDHLQARWSPLNASLVVWIAWALWHAPLDYFRPGGFSLAMFLKTRVVFLLPIVFIFTWLYNRAGRSIQTTAVLHAGMNTFPFILPYFMPGFALLFVVAGYVIVADRMWRYKQSSLELEEP